MKIRSLAVLLLAIAAPARADLQIFLWRNYMPTVAEAYANCMSKTPLSGYDNNNYSFKGCYLYNGDGVTEVIGRAEWDSQGHGHITAFSHTNYVTGCVTGQAFDVATGQCAQATQGPFPISEPDKNLGRSCEVQPAVSLMCGNPINSASGNKLQIETDLDAGLLSFARFYNSAPSGPSHIVGQHWMSSLGRRVIAAPGQLIVSAVRADGRSLTFYGSGGDWTASAEIVAKLAEVRDAGGNRIGWTFQEVDGREVENYDAQGRLTAVTRSNGEGIWITYNQGVQSGTPADYLPTQVVDHAGRSISMSYTSGRLYSLIDSVGGAFVYGYDSSDRLTSVTYPGGAVRTYHYNESAYTSGANLPFALTGISNDSQRFATFQYYADGRAKSTEHAGGLNKYSVVYNSNGTSVVTEPLGATDSRTYVSPQGALRVSASSRTAGASTRTQSSSFDTAGRLDVHTDALGVTSDYNFNSAGRLTQVIFSANQAATKRTVQTDWHPTFDLPTERRTYDHSGALVAKSIWTYNARGQILTESSVDPTGALPPRTTTYTYCDSVGGWSQYVCPRIGLLASIDGPRTDVPDVTSYLYYYTRGCSEQEPACHRPGDVYQVLQTNNGVTHFFSYDDAGRATSFQDPNGVITDLEYTPRGQLSARKVRGADPYSEADDAITHVEYWPTGDVKKVTLPDGTYTGFTYNAARFLTSVTDSMGNSVHYTPDNAGNRAAEEFKDSSNAVRHSLSRIYSGLNELKTLADAFSTPTDFTYDANGALDTSTDPLGRVTDNSVDPLGRLIQVIANTGGGTSDKATTQFEYNARDQLTAVVDPKGLRTEYTYNGLGDLVQLSSPDTQVTVNGYDSAGNRAQSTDARGKLSTFTYDSLGRLRTQQVPAVSQNVVFSYDEYWHAWVDDSPVTECAATELFGIGRLGGILDESGSTRFCYDRRGNAVRKVQTVAGGSKLTVAMTYNGADRLVAMTYPSGAIVTYLRNGNGQIRAIDAIPASGQAQVALVTSVTYLPFGPLNAITFGNGRVLTKAYDANYVIDKVSDSAISNPLSQDFGADLVGRISSLSERTSATAIAGRSFAYDGLGRLKDHKNGNQFIERFTYDPTGNRLTKRLGNQSTSNYAYYPSNHRLRLIGSIERSYDPNGNALSIGAGSYVYDDRNRLREFKLNSVLRASYRYNGLGERVLKTDAAIPANSRQFVYNADGRLLGEYTLAGVAVKEYVWLEETLVAVLSTFDGSSYQFVETDHLGTPRAIVHPAENTIAWRWDLSPTAFGDHLPNGNPDGDSFTYNMDLRFPGQYFDSESGGHYNFFRNYEPATGRYLQSDPIGLAAGPSTYGYVGSSPLNFSDPLGLIAWICRRGNAVGIAIPIHFRNDSTVTAKDLNRIKSGIEKLWSGRYETRKGDIHLEVRVVPVGPGKRNIYNEMFVHDGVSPTQTNWENRVWCDENADTFAHEAGHLMGLLEHKYSARFKGNVMFSALNSPYDPNYVSVPGTVWPINVEELLRGSNPRLLEGCGK